MNKKLVKALVAGTLSLTCAFACFASACNGDPGESDEYAVVINYNEGVRPHTLYVEKGSSVAESDLAIPTREGYSFSKWTSDADGEQDVVFPYTPSADSAIYAQWDISILDVTFDYNLGEETNAEETSFVKQVEYNGTVTQADVDEINETVPERDGYLFGGYWVTATQQRVDFTNPYVVKRDTTFYAYWRADDVALYEVTFNANYDGAAEYAPIEVEEGDTIEARQAPSLSRTGYTFLGWATTPDATEKEIDFPYEPTSNVTLYAVWDRASYAVRFRYNYADNPGGRQGIYQTVNAYGGDAIDEPEAITREGFEFTGWYTSAVGGERVEFPYTVNEAGNFYAQWQSVLVNPNNNIFDAEFTPIDPHESFPGQSGSTHGVGIIQCDDTGAFGSHSEEHPLLDDHATHHAHYVTYLFKPGAALTYNIYSETAVSNVSLYASLSTEIIAGGFTITPEGQYGFQFIINDVSLNYGSISITGHEEVGVGSSQYVFEEYLVGTINLNAGWNTIVLSVNNASGPEGTTLTAMGPRVDYIRLDTSASLSWRPEYDNLYRTA